MFGWPATTYSTKSKELKLLEEKIANGDHILLTGQRRMGKTTLAHAIGERLTAKGWVPLFIDVEDATSPEDVVATIAAAAGATTPPPNAFTASITSSGASATKRP